MFVFVFVCLFVCFFFQFQNFIIKKGREAYIQGAYNRMYIFMLFLACRWAYTGEGAGGELIKRQRCKRFKRSGTTNFALSI